MNPNKKIFFLILISIFALPICLTSCGPLDEESSKELKKEWVYIELVTMSKRDTTDYFYFGQVKKSIINQIDSNEEAKGLFTLSNIRLWNDDDLLELYEDEKLKGSIIFKIQDIQEVTLYKDDPINLFESEKLHKSAKEFKAANN